MTEHNRYDRANKYDRPNRYATDPGKPEPSPKYNTPAPIPAPTSVLLPASTAWQSRTTAPAVYQPALGHGRRARRRALRLAENQAVAKTVAAGAVEFTDELTRLEKSTQALEEARERGTLIPLKVEKDRLALGEDVVKAQITFAAAVAQLQDAHVEHQRGRRLDGIDFEITMQHSEVKLLEAQALAQAARARLDRADAIGSRRADVDFHKATQESMQHQADAAEERRRRDQALRSTLHNGPADDMPPDLQGPLATERTVTQTRGWVERKIAAIEKRAQEQGRPLTDDEVEQIDQLENARDSGEALIRRRGASDVS